MQGSFGFRYPVFDPPSWTPTIHATASPGYNGLMQFVIQIHSGSGPTHWDLMLQDGQALATWQLAAPPPAQAGAAIPARPLAAHRVAYLTYEGPVSNNRGRVDKLDGGDYVTLSRTPGRWEFQLRGAAIAGRFELAAQGEAWLLRRIG